ncbi:lipid II:glycine glycyltransferase FemX [Halogranum rubrum]|uniref:BioF2-like acetyltransferase domain-containing protein n=1 Tax=Halogranum salarium B-1 TaxID=1210908 RepID=J3JDN8_9EURY|nr:GNAT family N-acetyltransferase [Halogranum salarium]EJN57651.1 hypothetical protein HSB1_40120 [Halogranum salarium B-1]
MSISISRIDESESTTWNDYVDRFPGTNPFHRWEGLQTVADYSGCRLHPLVGYNGNQPVALVPLYEHSARGRTLVRSPPRLVESFPLGPVFAPPGGMKRRKTERNRTEFVDAVQTWLDEHVDPSYVHIRAGPVVSDVRTFQWNGYDATPFYTYFLDLTPDPDDLLASFSRDARTNVRDAEEAGVTVREGDKTDVKRIIRQVERRHHEQDESYPMPVPFVADCYSRLPEGAVRAYVAEMDGEMVSGIVTLETEDVIYRWQGGVKYGGDAPATDLLDWHVMQAARDRGIEQYDLVGANMRRLCGYKAKFSPEPVVYYNLTRHDRLHQFLTDAQSLADGLVHGFETLRHRVDR